MIGQVVLPLTDLSLSQDNVFRTDIRPSLKVCTALIIRPSLKVCTALIIRPSLKVCMRWYLLQRHSAYRNETRYSIIKQTHLKCRLIMALLVRNVTYLSSTWTWKRNRWRPGRSINLTANCWILVSSAINQWLAEAQSTCSLPVRLINGASGVSRYIPSYFWIGLFYYFIRNKLL